MKVCPHCDGELRDSVIRCTHCGRSLREDEELDGEPIQAVGSPKPTPVRQAQSSSRPLSSSIPTPPQTARRPTDVWASAPAAPPVSPLADVGAHRALPTTKRSWGPDMWLLWAGMAAVAAGVLAYFAVNEPWVHLTVTRSAEDFGDAQIVEITLRGRAAFVGAAGQVLAIALAAFGLIWFFYGFQRGWSMPSIVNPVLAILVTVSGIAMTALSSLVWFVWEDAMLLRASTAGLTTGEMRELLDHQPTPLIEIERLSGLMTFGGMMVAGLVAACIGWWAYRRRG